MGKSTVSAMFSEKGIPVLDADEVVHKLYAKGGAAVEPVQKEFPTAVVDGAVSRPLLSQCVVGNEGAMRRLEALVHPLVQQQRQHFLQQMAAAGHQLVVLDIPLLYETKLDKEVDAVAVVSASAELQKQRVLARPGMTEEKFSAILARQVPDEEKRRRADFVIDTSVSLEETGGHVTALIAALKGRQGSVWQPTA